MGLSKPAVTRIAAGALLLLLPAFLPSASAQLPPETLGAAVDLVILCSRSGLLEPDYAGQDEVECELRDISRDSVYPPDATSGTSVSTHTISSPGLVAVNESVNARGWQAETTLTGRGVYGGDVIPFVVRAKATPNINTQDYHFELIVNVSGPGGYAKTLRAPFVAEVNRYDFASIAFANLQAQKAGQDEVVTYTIAVTNSGVYPDSYRFILSPSHEDLRISTPPNLYVPPGETRTTNVSVLTPYGKLFELGRSATIGIKVASVAGSGIYSTTAVLNIRGAYVPTYWIPLVLVGLVSASVLVRGSREKVQLHALEKGRPRRVEVSPRQAVLLAELRRSDRQSYEEKQASLDSVYRERLADYRAHRKERLAADREEARQARAEFLAAKKARKAKRAELKREEKRVRAEQRRSAKHERKQAKKDAKLLKKKEKVLGKKRAKLEKQKAKADARQAKLDAKQAKLDARAERKAAKEAKKQGK